MSLTTAGCPIRNHFQQAVAQSVAELDDVSAVEVGFDVLSDEEKSGLQQKLGRGKLPDGALAQVKNVICVASGKGGVGKSTMTPTSPPPWRPRATRSARSTATSTLLDPPHARHQPEARGLGRAQDHPAPLARRPQGDVDRLFRGRERRRRLARPMLHKAIQQFLEDVAWDELDYLLLDLPPGTGDVSMTLAQLLPQSKIVIVTTPQPAAQSVAARTAEMAAKVDLEVMGVIENMSAFTGPDGNRSRSSARAAVSSSPTSSTFPCSPRFPWPRTCASTPTTAVPWSATSRTPRPLRRSTLPPRHRRPEPGRAARDRGRRRRRRPRRRDQREELPVVQ